MKFALLLGTYCALLLGTGYLTFVKFVGMPNIPGPEVVATLGSDPEFKKDLLDDVKVSRERNADLIRLSAHSFDVIVGALLGFLSATATSVGIGAKASQKSPNGTERDVRQPPPAARTHEEVG